VQGLQIHSRRASLALFLPENARRAVEKLAFPLRDLIGVNVELLRQLGQRLLALVQRDMCGRPRLCKKFFDATLPIWSGAVMCPAFACGG